LEEIALKVALIQGTVPPRPVKGRAILTFAADHGVTHEGVSAYPAEVTPQMVANMVAGGAAINALAKGAGAQLVVVDVGVAVPLAESPSLVQRKVRSGTANLAREAAMTDDEALAALAVGLETAERAIEQGADLLGTGEMGIGNTTAAAAVLAALLPCSVADITGRGTGIDDATLAHKVAVIDRALTLHQPRLDTPLGVLAAVGGLEIAAIAGVALAGAVRRVPVVIDGFISSAGALVACRLCPAVKDYLLFSHLSAEVGHQTFAELFEVRPLLDLGLRLGEGTGAALAMSLVDAALAISSEMASFASAAVSGKSR
jgi:nicotinate-nucleotide--dimethylbenzimidazole phosphoribosyltransferase